MSESLYINYSFFIYLRLSFFLSLLYLFLYFFLYFHLSHYKLNFSYEAQQNGPSWTPYTTPPPDTSHIHPHQWKCAIRIYIIILYKYFIMFPRHTESMAYAHTLLLRKNMKCIALCAYCFIKTRIKSYT